MNIKQYTVTHITGASITVKIDIDFENLQYMIKSMVEFWAGWQPKLFNNDNDYTATYLKSLCEECIRVMMLRNELDGVIKYFEDNEGWCRLDGTSGITLTSVDRPDFSDDSEYVIS